ncbi:MAG: 16S rRNA (cytidine(1402)-2'-O)-methyltransferase [Anaerolineae bacterium]|nr:16S rRNA (cytidine(1402)-2'-O)-methyltransferase [Anaerolineae bacterium]
MGTLYLVPTPIGNLEDITLRALRVLREVQLIAAEDTRTSRVLLNHYEITTPLTSYHEHNKLNKLDQLFEALATGDVALISDAGMPGISDPGYELVGAAIAQGYRVEPLPGANAVITALVGSGLPTDSFIYLGFLPRKHLNQFWAALATEPRTLVAYESPNRLTHALKALHETLGERPVCVARELSKKFEEFKRGAAGEVLAYYEEHPPRGEITLVVGGAVIDEVSWTEDRVRAVLAEQLAAGESLSQAAKTVAAAAGWEKRAVYALNKDADNA